RQSSWLRIRPSLHPLDHLSLIDRSSYQAYLRARKNSVSVAPGIKQVTVTPVSFNSLRNAKENESMNAFVRKIMLCMATPLTFLAQGKNSPWECLSPHEG